MRDAVMLLVGFALAHVLRWLLRKDTGEATPIDPSEYVTPESLLRDETKWPRSNSH